MTEERKLIKKLSEIMKEVKYIEKRGENKFHKYKYATEADVNEKVREFLADRFILMIPSMKNHTVREHTNRQGNTEYIVTVDMTFTFSDGETGEEMTLTMSGSGQDAGDKGIMKAISAAQKYALMKLFMIPTGDDPEADSGVDERNAGVKPQNNPNNKNSSPPRPEYASEPQVKKINIVVSEIIKAKGDTTTKDDIYEALKGKGFTFNEPKDVPKSQASKMIQQLEAWRDKAKGGNN
jgi:hypothetical protein